MNLSRWLHRRPVKFIAEIVLLRLRLITLTLMPMVGFSTEWAIPVNTLSLKMPRDLAFGFGCPKRFMQESGIFTLDVSMQTAIL